MYDELIRKLRELASIPAHCENVDSCDGCSKEDICLRFTNERIIETASEAADAIESTSKAYQMMAEAYEAEVTKPKWIPVTERLPEESGSYIIVDGRIVMEGLYEKDWVDYPWTDPGEMYMTYHPSHWMPLPQPPESENV